jgi:hypothetical protein
MDTYRDLSGRNVQVCQTQACDLGYDLSALRASGNHNYASKFNPKLPYK